jgi:acyl carrier protein
MGLDGVELVMAFEEAFGVTISDEEAEACVTPAIVIDVVLAKLRTTEERLCLPQRGFHALRKAIVETVDAPRNRIKLGLDVRSLVLSAKHKEFWTALRAKLHARRWPELERPRWIIAGLTCGVLLILGASIWVGHPIFGVVFAFFFGAMARHATRPLRRYIPFARSKIRDLVPYAMTSDFILWHRDQVAELVRKIVMEQLDLKEGQYREDAQFIRDLGMD